MRDSIRWTLIGWYGLLLAAVLCAFGFVTYRRAEDAARAGIDAELEGRARAIAAALEWDEQDGWELELSDDYLRGLASESRFAVFAADGVPIRSGGAGALDPPAFVEGFREQGDLRAIELDGPHGSRVLVGRSVAAEHARSRALLAYVVAAGAAVLALALAGGAWLARRSLAPVARLAAAAAAIGERDLGARLDVSRCPDEVRGLARAFNDLLERLQAAFARQARFTADASHELRTPLAVVRTQAEQALRRPRSVDEYQAALSACARGAERMSGVVEGLLALARADAGEALLRADEVELDALVREGAERARPAAEAARIELALALEPVRVRGDALLLADLLANLLDNALRYNREGGRVDVTLARAGRRARLVVSDTGRGVAAEHLPRLFERFYRADASRSRAREGSGLGLAIALAIAEAHGGTIEVASREGVGSSFTVELPGCANGAAGAP